MIQVSHAVHHAHQKGVIHRDLKPGNILVAEYDGLPLVKVIDFGLAKALGEPLTDDSVNTGFFGVAGTIEYMAPEQATFNQLDIDTRVDVYSMTVVLYELLTGSTPHSAQELKLAGVMEQLRMVREEEPPRASNRLSTSAHLPRLAAFRQSEPRRLIGILRRELDAVLMKGLDKDRERRYGGPNDFADDLQRFLNREPVKAVPPSFAYRASKYVRKHWKPLVVVALAISVVGGLVGMGWQEYRRWEVERGKELSDLKAKAEERKRELADAKAAEADARAEITRRNAAAQMLEADSKDYIGTMGKAAQEENLRAPGWAERSWELLQRAATIQTPLRNEADIRSAAATVLIADEYRTRPDWPPIKTKARAVAYSPTGDLLAIAPYSDDSRSRPRLLVLNAISGETKETLSGEERGPPQDPLRNETVSAVRSRFSFCAFDTDQSLLGMTEWGRLYRWDLSRSSHDPKFVDIGTNIASALLTPNGRWCVTQCVRPGRLQCWDSRTLELIGDRDNFETDDRVVCVVDNESILVRVPSGDIHFLTLPDLKEKESSHRINSTFHPSGEYYIGFDGQTMHAMSWPDGVRMHTYHNPERETPVRPEVAASAEFRHHLGFSPTGQFFAANFRSDRGGEVRVWDAWGGKPRWRVPTPDGSILKWDGYAIADDAGHTALLTQADVVQYSRLRPELAFSRAPGHSNGVRHVRTAPDGTAIAVLGERRKDGNDSLVVWQTCDAPQLLHSSVAARINSIPREATDALSYSTDGKWLATVGNSNATGIAVIVSSATNLSSNRVVKVPHEVRTISKGALNAGEVVGFGWTSRGELVAAIEAELFAWNPQINPPRLIGRAAPPDLFSGVRSYASLAMNGADVGWAITIQSELRRFQVGDGQIAITKRMPVPGDGNSRICRIDPSNRWLAISKADGSVVLFDTTSEVFSTPMTEAHADSVQAMCWLSNRRLVTGSRDGWFANWNVSDKGEASLWYRVQLKAPVSDIAPTAEKQAVYVACSDETSLRVLDLACIDRELAMLFSTSPASSPSDPFSTVPATVAKKRTRGNVTVRVTCSVMGMSSVAAINHAAEREAAEWVLSIGGHVTVNEIGGRPLTLSDGKLPDVNFTVDTVSLVEPSRFTNEGLSKLSACRRFASLRFVRVANLTDEGFSQLKGVRVRELLLDGCALLTDEAMDSVATLEELESLSLQRVGITDAGIAALAPLQFLRTINFGTSQITDAGLLELALICPKIDNVSIDWSPDGKQSVRGIARFHHLMQFIINGGQLTDDAVVVMNTIPALDILTIRSPMDDLTLKRITRIKALRVIHLDSTGNESITSLSATILSDITWPQGLQALYFNGSSVSPRDEDLLSCAYIPGLKVIGVGCPNDEPQRYTHSGLLKLRELRRDLYIEVGRVAYEPDSPLPLTAPKD